MTSVAVEKKFTPWGDFFSAPPPPPPPPKVGHKPPKIVPFLTNCWYGVDDPARDRRGNNLPAVVAKYREVSCAVDGANQMALRMRQMGRSMTWSHAVRAFMLWYAAGNAFATCKALGLVDEKTTMWEFQWDILKRRYFAHPEEPAARRESVVHAPVRHTQRKLCTYCGEGRTHWACAACGTAMHITCFGPAHDVE